MVADNFDGMLELLSVDTFDLKNLKKQYRIAALKHHPDKGGDEASFKILSQHYQLLLPLVDQATLSAAEINSINVALQLSSYKTRKIILEQIKIVNVDVFNSINALNVIDSEAEWINFNTRVLDGEIFSKATFESFSKISQSRYSQFFTPYESKSEFFSAAGSFTYSSLKLSIYLFLSTSALDYLIISTAFLGFHDPVKVNTNNLQSDLNSISFTLKASLYSILLDAITTLVKPFIELLSLVVRSAVTIASLCAVDNTTKSAKSNPTPADETPPSSTHEEPQYSDNQAPSMAR